MSYDLLFNQFAGYLRTDLYASLNPVNYFIGLCPLACALCLLSSCLSLFFSTFAVVSVPLLNRLIIIASPYITINDNTSGIPISIYPSMACLELQNHGMRTESLNDLDQNSFLTAIPNDNSSKKGSQITPSILRNGRRIIRSLINRGICSYWGRNTWCWRSGENSLPYQL